MSRKWERMVNKNSKKVNQHRSKQGIPSISSSEQPHVFKGRSILVSLFFLIVFLFLLATYTKSDQNGMYLFTLCSYLLVGLLIFFVRRPYLKVSKTNLRKRGFSRELIVGAESIKKITCSPSSVVIELNNKTQWVYSKLMSRFDIVEIAKELRKFAERNQVAFEDKTLK